MTMSAVKLNIFRISFIIITISISLYFIIYKANAVENSIVAKINEQQKLISEPYLPSITTDEVSTLPMDSFIIKQTPSVKISCFPENLTKALINISLHFGQPVIVTSGHRPSGRGKSMHKTCNAADIQIKGISPNKIAKYARTIPEVGGIGMYSHTRSIHVDTRAVAFGWYNKKSRVAYKN